jgi:hypothetical protein
MLRREVVRIFREASWGVRLRVQGAVHMGLGLSCGQEEVDLWVESQCGVSNPRWLLKSDACGVFLLGSGSGTAAACS